jgi:uncharacterized SAM-binding protein YcdF (DUF218 family)
MIRLAVGILVVGILAIVGLTFYLQPNDLASCEEKPSSTGSCTKVDAIVAISGGDTDARTDEAIRLYKNGWADKMVFSGAALDTGSPSNALVMKQRAVAAGVPSGKIFIDEHSNNTAENAKNSNNIFADEKINTIILVTSGYHQRRASMEFNEFASNVLVKNKPVVADKDWSPWWWVTPWGWWLALGELVKSIVR